jgi:hypothetical protein
LQTFKDLSAPIAGITETMPELGFYSFAKSVSVMSTLSRLSSKSATVRRIEQKIRESP